MTRGRASRVVGIVLLLVVSAASADDAAWEELARARDELETGALVAEFVQTYVPAGFSSGDEEAGRLFLLLPGCLRWDYEEPYPRRYLLCGETAWAWSPDETVGDRYLSVSREEAGLDFLMLSVERLRGRYEATIERHGEGGSRIELIADRQSQTAFARAEIVLQSDSGRPSRLAYTDREGNETRFDLTLYRSLEDTSLFQPPLDIEWVDAD